MLLLDKNGYIIGFNTKEDNKPAPFPIDKARWNGKDWEYPEIDEKLIEKKNIPSLIEKNTYDSFSILCRIQEKISPSSGGNIPDIILIKVLLPAPLWPKRQNISFGNNSPLKLSTAFKSLKFFETFNIFKLLFIF
jgi:hypothetical protein